MRKIFMAVGCLLVYSASLSQATDTGRYNPRRIDIHDRHWAVNFNTGTQKRFYIGAGISRSYFLGSPHGVYGYDLYSSFSIFPAFNSKQNSMVAINLGAIFCGSGLVMGAELKYLKSKGVEDIQFIPKGGIGFSMLHLTYGYAVSTKQYPISGLGKNVITLHFNLPFYTRNLLKKEQEKPGRSKK